MTDDTACFELPAVMKIEDCERLHAFLLGAQGQDIQIDCHAVERLSGLAAQTLMMINVWRKNAQQVTLKSPSLGFIDGLATLGLPAQLDLVEVAS